jgi:hypothetical protein
MKRSQHHDGSTLPRKEKKNRRREQAESEKATTRPDTDKDVVERERFDEAVNQQNASDKWRQIQSRDAVRASPEKTPATGAPSSGQKSATEQSGGSCVCKK